MEVAAQVALDTRFCWAICRHKTADHVDVRSTCLCVDISDECCRFCRHIEIDMSALVDHIATHMSIETQYFSISPGADHARSTRPYNDLPLLPPGIEHRDASGAEEMRRRPGVLAELRLAGHLIPDQCVFIQAIPNLGSKGQLRHREHRYDQRRPISRGKSGRLEAPSRDQGSRALPHCPLCGVDRGHQEPATLDTNRRRGLPHRSPEYGTRYSAQRQAPRWPTCHTGEVIYTPPEGEARLRGLLANWERSLHESPDVGSARSHGRAALPVRGHPPVSGWQRTHRAHPEHAVA